WAIFSLPLRGGRWSLLRRLLRIHQRRRCSARPGVRRNGLVDSLSVLLATLSYGCRSLISFGGVRHVWAFSVLSVSRWLFSPLRPWRVLWVSCRGAQISFRLVRGYIPGAMTSGQGIITMKTTE